MSELKETLDAIDDATADAAARPYYDVMVVVFKAMWSKGKAILEKYPTVQDGRGKTSKGGGGSLVLVFYKDVARKTERNSQDIKKWVLIAEKYPSQEEALEWAKGKAQQATDKLLEIKAETKVPLLPEGDFRIVYADPPWKYGDELIEGYGAATHHYRIMDVAELCEMGEEVRAKTNANAVLFLWVPAPILPDAFSVLDAWGFVYKAQFIWDKIKHNYGHYNSVRHELLLVATRGKCLPDVHKLFDSVQVIERTEKHSEKPEQFREIIDLLYPEGARVELFRRGAKPKGWEAMGDELR